VHGLLQCGLFADDPDDTIIDLDAVNHGSQIGLPERDFAACDVLAHCPAETFDHVRREISRGQSICPDAVKGRLVAFAVQFERVDAALQDVIHFRNPVLDHPVKALQLILGVGNFSLERGNPAVDFRSAARTPR